MHRLPCIRVYCFPALMPRPAYIHPLPIRGEPGAPPIAPSFVMLPSHTPWDVRSTERLNHTLLRPAGRYRDEYLGSAEEHYDTAWKVRRTGEKEGSGR
jgi:hypothetical protein